MWRFWLGSIGVIALMATPAAGLPDKAPPDPAAAQALLKLSAVNELDIEAGALAMEKGGTAEIRRFGDRLVRDHRFAQRLVQADARRMGIALSEGGRPGTELRELQRLSGRRFDESFLNTMEVANQTAQQFLTAMSARVTDQKTRALLAGLGSIVQQHQDLATILLGQTVRSHEGGGDGASPAKGRKRKNR